MRLKSTLALIVAGAAVCTQAATIQWNGSGGDGQWYTGANWDGGAVPVIDGTDDAVITSATATYVPGGDLNFTGGSTLTMDGGSLTQTTTHWTRYNNTGYFTLRNGSLLDFANAKTDIHGYGSGSTFTIDNSTWTTRELFADDHKSFMLSNGATANLTGGLTQLQNGSLFDVTDSTLNLRNVDFQAYGGNATFINVNNGAQVNLLNTTSLGTGVITKAGDSMVNFAAGSSGSVFIDNLSVAELETMIGESKFGVGGTISTTLTDYTYSTSGAGVTVAIPEPATFGMIIAFGGGLLLIRRNRAF